MTGPVAPERLDGSPAPWCPQAAVAAAAGGSLAQAKEAEWQAFRQRSRAGDRAAVTLFRMARLEAAGMQMYQRDRAR